MLELWQCSATELHNLYACGEASPVEALRSVLGRINAANPRLNAFVALDAEGALRAARASEARWRQGRPLSALDGIPLSVKDNIPVRGLPTTWGSRLWREPASGHDELPVARARAAGAVLLGKTNVPEFTLQGYTDNRLFGPTHNPWRPGLTPGGSSGGAAAAVAAGMGPLALATDGGGSIRRPAGHTGLVGLKPTLGRVARRDGLPAMLLDFEVIGPLARRVSDIAPLMEAIARPARSRPGAPAGAFARPGRPPRLRILRLLGVAGAAVDPAIAAAMDTVAARLSALGHAVETRENLDLVDEINRAVWPVLSQGGLAWLLRRLPGWREQLDDSLRPAAEAGMALSAADLMEALDRARQVREDLEELQQHWDVLLTPTAAAMPWAADRPFPETIAGRPVGPRGHAVFTAFVNATGVPALALPAPRSADGLPIGFQLVGRAGEDELLCALGQEYEDAHPWKDDRPDLRHPAPAAFA